VKGTFPANDALQHEQTFWGAEEEEPEFALAVSVGRWFEPARARNLNSAAAARVSLSWACAFNIAWNHITTT